MLEVLDPEQNNTFRDHYLDVPFDLSKVMFITTANQLEPVPGPLRDRMEIISLAGYTERREAARSRSNYLVPKQRRGQRPAAQPGHLRRRRSSARSSRSYTREAGVRNLEREIGSICRKLARMVAENGTGRRRFKVGRQARARAARAAARVR